MKKVLILLICFTTVLLSDNQNKQEKWFVKSETYEGFPLMLRYPEKPKVDKLKSKYNTLLSIEHKFSKVKSNGLPESKYNKSLYHFDDYLTNLFEKEGLGKTVLIETFGGKRIYYIYISEKVQLEKYKKQTKSKYSQHDLLWETKVDKKWNFLKEYSEDFKFYKKEKD